MHIFARQGDLVIDERPAGTTGEWTPARDVVFAGDSSGHRHRLLGNCEIMTVGAVTRVKLAEPRELIHEKSDGHGGVWLPAGMYEVRRLRERGDGSDRAVED